MTDVLKGLQTASWRGLEFPIVSGEYGFTHEQVEQKYTFKDEALIESQGRKNQTFKYVIPFSENIAKGPFKSLYVEAFPKFLNSCLDRSAGILETPDLGAFQAKCVEFTFSLDPDVHRDGVWATISWIHAPAQDDYVTDLAFLPPTLENVVSEAGALDQLLVGVNWQQEPVPEPTTDVFGAITGTLDQLNRNVNKIAATIQKGAFKLNKMNDSLDRLSDTRNSPVKRAVLNLQHSLLRTSRNLGRTDKRIRKHVTSDAIGLTVLASQLQVTVADILTLNPDLAKRPRVAANTVVKYFKAA